MNSLKNRIARIEDATFVDEEELPLMIVSFCNAPGQPLGPVIGLKESDDGVRVDRLPGETIDQLKERFLSAWRAAGPKPNCMPCAIEIYPDDSDPAPIAAA